jgi:PAS domain-containing protein
MNPQEFASRIKAKYPEYAGLGDDELTARILAKHPEYRQHVDMDTRVADEAAARLESRGVAPGSKVAMTKDEPGFAQGFADQFLPSGESLSEFASMLNLRGPVEQAKSVYGIGKSIAGAHLDQMGKAKDSYLSGDIVEGMGHAAAAAMPVIGPAAAAAGEEIEKGNIAYGLGRGAGLVGDVLMPGPAGRAVSKAPNALRASGAEIYGRALKPRNPMAAEAALPRMVEEGLTPKTDLSPRIKDASYELFKAETEHTAVPHDVSPLIESLEKMKSQFRTATGSVVAGRESLLREVAKLQRALGKASHGGVVTTGDLVKQRVALDDIAEGRGAFKGVDPSTSAEAAKSMADVLRAPLNRIEAIGKANAEYSYLKTAESILRDAPGLVDTLRHGLMAAVNTARGFKGAAVLDAARAGFAPGMRTRVGLAMDRLGGAFGGTTPSRGTPVPAIQNLEPPVAPTAERPTFAAGEDGGALPVNAGAQSMVAPVENAAFRRAVSAADEQALIREMEAAGGEMPAATRGMFAVDETGRALPWNDSAESLAGYSSSDLLRQMFDESMQRDAARLGAGNTMQQAATATATRALPPAPDPVYAATPDGRIAPSTMPGLLRGGADSPANLGAQTQSGAAGLRGQMFNPAVGDDVFGYQVAVDRLRSQVQGVPKELQPQVLSTKKAVYRAPDGSMVNIPTGVQKSFLNNFGTGSEAVSRWLDAMRKQGKIKPGGQLVFIDQ